MKTKLFFLIIILGIWLGADARAGEWKTSHCTVRWAHAPANLTVWAGSETRCAQALEASLKELERIGSIFFVYRQGSEINQLNQYAGERPMPVSAEVLKIINWATSISQWTQGTFDITTASFKWEYGFGQGDYRVPNPLRLDQIKPLVNYRYVLVYPQEKTVIFKRLGVQIDVDEIAESYALNRIYQIMRSYKIKSASIRLGRNSLVFGPHPAGGLWQVPVTQFLDNQRTIAQVPISQGKLLVASIQDHGFFRDSQYYHHFLDVKTGQPVNYSQLAVLMLPLKPKIDLPVSVLLLFPPDQAVQRIAAIPGAECFIVDQSNKIWFSPTWQKQLSVEWP